MYSKLILRACAEACALNDPIMIKKNFFFVKMFGRKKKIKIVKISQQHVLKNIWRGMDQGGGKAIGQQKVYGVNKFL